MSTDSSNGGTDLRPIGEEFLDLVCADEDLLRAEFDAIISATWSPPPARPPDSPARADRSGRAGPQQPRWWPSYDIPSSGDQGRSRSRWFRQRSPPPTTAGIEQAHSEGE